MRQISIKRVIAAFFSAANRHSWAFGVFGVALAAIGGVITNATVSAYLKTSCGAEGQACFDGVESFLLKTPEGLMVSLGALFTSVSIFVSYTDKIEIDKLRLAVSDKEDQIESLTFLNTEVADILDKRSIDSFEMLSLYLKHVASELRLGIEERISIYKVSDDYFFLVERFSENHSYSKVGRSYYQRQQGIIESACERNWAQVEMQCAYDTNASRRKKYADEHLRRFRIPAQVVNNFKIKSRSYRALAIRGAGARLPASGT
jgi:hypothetical protein